MSKQIAVCSLAALLVASAAPIAAAVAPQTFSLDEATQSGAEGDSALETEATDGVTADKAAPQEIYGPVEERPQVTAPTGVPLALAEGVASAVDNFPRVRAALLNIRASQSDVKAAKRRWLPSVQLQALSFAGGNPIAGTDPFALNFVVDQPIWNGGRIGAEIGRAKVAQSVSEARATEIAESVSVQVINSFYEAVLAKRRLTKLREGQRTLQELIETIRRRVAQNVSPMSDLILAQSRLAEIEQQITFADATFYSARETYRQVTGLYDYDFGTLPEYDRLTMHPAAMGAVEEAMQCNPATRVASAERDLAVAGTRVAKSLLYPQLSAQYSLNEVTGSRFGLVVTAQLQNGASQFSVIESSKTRELEAAAEADAAGLEGRLRITSDLLLNYSARDQIPIGMRSVAAAEEVTASYRRQFIAGRRSWLDVINAVREEITADLSLVDSETSAMASAARILIYSCRWTPVIGSE